MKNKFLPALNGLVTGLKDRSVIWQVGLGLLAIGIACMFHFSLWKWCILLLCIGMVIGFEMVNTCLEKMCDLIDEKPNLKIRIIKDMAAGSVLWVSIISLVIGILLCLIGE